MSTFEKLCHQTWQGQQTYTNEIHHDYEVLFFLHEEQLLLCVYIFMFLLVELNYNLNLTI